MLRVLCSGPFPQSVWASQQFYDGFHPIEEETEIQRIEVDCSGSLSTDSLHAELRIKSGQSDSPEGVLDIWRNWMEKEWLQWGLEKWAGHRYALISDQQRKQKISDQHCSALHLGHEFLVNILCILGRTIFGTWEGLTLCKTFSNLGSYSPY